MALSNAEKQAQWRARRKQRIRDLEWRRRAARREHQTSPIGPVRSASSIVRRFNIPGLPQNLDGIRHAAFDSSVFSGSAEIISFEEALKGPVHQLGALVLG